jgi:hypothetical protein
MSKKQTNLFIAGILKVTDEKSRIRVPNPMYGSVSKCQDPEHWLSNVRPGKYEQIQFFPVPGDIYQNTRLR